MEETHEVPVGHAQWHKLRGPTGCPCRPAIREQWRDGRQFGLLIQHRAYSVQEPLRPPTPRRPSGE